MSTEVALRRIAFCEQEIEDLQGKLPFFARLKQKYWNGQMKLVLAFGALKASIVAGLIWGKAIWAFFAVKFPVTAALLAKAWMKLVVLAVGAVAVAFGS